MLQKKVQNLKKGKFLRKNLNPLQRKEERLGGKLNIVRSSRRKNWTQVKGRSQSSEEQTEFHQNLLHHTQNGTLQR